MSHRFESTWSAHKQKQHNCTHKATDVGNSALIWSARLSSFDSQRVEIRSVVGVLSASRIISSSMLFKMLFGDVSRFGSFPADCNAAWLPFNAGDNSAPAVSTSCVWPQASSSPSACRWRSDNQPCGSAWCSQLLKQGLVVFDRCGCLFT